MPTSEKQTAKYSTKELLKDCWFLLSGYKLKFFIYTLILAISNSMPFIITYYLGKIVDFFTNYHGGDPLNFFYMSVGIIGLSGAAQVYLRFLCKWEILQIGTDIRMKIRILAMTKLVDLDLKWHEKEETGSKMQKITSGSDSIYRAFRFFVDSGVSMLTGLIGSIIILWFFNVKYMLFALVFLIIYLYGEYEFNKILSYWQDKMNIAKEKVSGKVHETAANILTVKTLGLKNNLKKSMEEYEEEYRKIWLESRKASQTKFKTQKIFTALLYALFILFIGFDVAKGLITVGSIIIFAGYFARLKNSLEDITNNLGELIEIKSGTGRIMTILDKKTIEKESYPYVDIPKDWKKIIFKNVSFKYKDKWIIRNLNLEIKRGEKIGLVGLSGSGKSTILKLLLGLYNPQEGIISIDNIPIGRAKHSSLTTTITAVLQDSEMFNLPLKDNISVTSENFNELRFNSAIRTSELAELIKKLPKGAETLIGEKGYRVSGGERQRIGIARAIYKNSDILVLDEATSHLDSKTESNIQKNLKMLMIDKTFIIIAHRLSTLRDVDKIVIIDEGKIIEEGSFEQLLKKKGKFYELYNLQKNK